MKIIILKALFFCFISSITCNSYAREHETAPLKLEELQDVIDNEYQTFVNKWMMVSLGERMGNAKYYDVSHIGASFKFAEDLINIKEVEDTFRAYCSYHKGFILEDKIPMNILLTERSGYFKPFESSSQMTCETATPNKVIGRMAYGKKIGKYTIRHFSGKNSMALYGILTEKINREAIPWKVGQYVTNGLFEGVILKIYSDTKQVAIQPNDKRVAPMINDLSDIFPVESLKTGQEIKTLSELKSNLSDDFNSFGKLWFPRAKWGSGMQSGATIERDSGVKRRVFKGYYPFSFIYGTFEAYCTHNQGKLILLLGEFDYKLYCVDTEKKDAIAKVDVGRYFPPVDNMFLSFSSTKNDYREFEAITKAREDKKNGVSKGEVIRVAKHSLSPANLGQKVVDSDAYGYYVQTQLNAFRWFAGDMVVKNIDY
ncbi:hypothetical protein [Formosimonas limnophila]|nr:hypothetical protein [Formosimonas limnophila]